MISETNSFTTGWVTYVRQAACKGALMELDDWERDDWLRRKLRCVRLKQCKRQTGPDGARRGLPPSSPNAAFQDSGYGWRVWEKGGGDNRAPRPLMKP